MPTLTNHIQAQYIQTKRSLSKYIKTAQMTAGNQTNGGIIYLLPDYIIRLVYLLPLMLLWRTLSSSGVETGMTLAQMLTYTFISNLFGELLNINSPLTHWVLDSPLVSYTQRPMTIFGHVVAETMGKVLPGLMFFSLPLFALASLLAFLPAFFHIPLLEISILPASLYFFPSMLLCISLGFALEFIFATLIIYMINTSWLVYSIRSAVVWLFSGAMLPFAILPFGLERVMRYQPLGSLAGAPLSIYAGISEPLTTIGVQITWNIIMWPIAIFVFNKAKERMVCHGG